MQTLLLKKRMQNVYLGCFIVKAACGHLHYKTPVKPIHFKCALQLSIAQ